jgi:hypothetical protein
MVAAAKPSEAAMWKFVFILLVTALSLLIAQLIANPPVIQTRVGIVGVSGVSVGVEAPALAYAGVRG